MNQEKITAAGLKKYLSLFEKSGVYWLCLLMLPGTDVFVSMVKALFYQNTINALMASDSELFLRSLWMAGVFLGASMSRCLITYIYMYQIRRIMQRLRLRVMTHLLSLIHI